MLTETIITLLMLSLSTAAITLTITRSSFSRMARDKLGESNLFAKLLNCPYCAQHWVAAPAALMMASTPIDFIVSWFALVALGSMIAGLMLRALFMPEAEIKHAQGQVTLVQNMLKQVQRAAENAKLNIDADMVKRFRVAFHERPVEWTYDEGIRRALHAALKRTYVDDTAAATPRSEPA